ncbi:MAG TPA: hypothetical protein VJH65_01280 [Candidatus Nanoarchaeia archaeon]|nr:hypothetical protein [Candidatus Nanoarchaeia archaeon]
MIKNKKAQLKTKKLKISSLQLLKNRSAQLKIQQMAFVLVAVVLFFVVVGIFILKVSVANLREQKDVLEEDNARLLVAKLANSPEFSCGEGFGTARANCIDLDKVMMLKENIEKYTGFWGVGNIEIIRIYPVREEGNIECNLGNYPNCNWIKLKEGAETGFGGETYVSLCRKEKYTDKIDNKCEIGKLIAG